MPAPAVVRRMTHASIVAALAAATLQATSALAAPPDSPVLIKPGSESSPSVEVSWEPVTGATGYEVRIDDDPAFGTPESTTQTANTVLVPTRLFATGTQHVSVRAKNSANEWGVPTTTSFTVVAPPAPELTFPDDGASLANPSDPPLLTWTPVPGAVSYTVEIDDESQFVGAPGYTTKANSFVVSDNQAPNVTYFWRVRATLANGVVSDRSATRTYTVLPIDTPVTTGPAYDEDVTDVVLDWDPVPGAKHYELQVDDDVNFGSPDTTVPAKIYSTRYSPRTTFANGQFYWRVRARDLDDNPTAWVVMDSDSHYFFDRAWRDQPQLVHPYDASGLAALQGAHDDLYFEWEPVRHASHYELWVSTDPNFTEPTTITRQCLVAGTTYTPGEHGDDCLPRSEGLVHYWKVRAMDAPYASLGVQGIFSETQEFVYTDEEFISITAPVAGSTAAVPTLDWEPVPSTATYQVELLQNGVSRKTDTTHSTSYTPFDLKLDPTKGTQLTWRIAALDNEDRISVTTSRTFTWDPTLVDTSTPLVPLAGPDTFDAPNLRWGAVAGADYYRIDVADERTPGILFGDATAPILSAKLHFPAATDTDVKFLDTGTYRWWVSAYSEDNLLLGRTPVGDHGTFKVLALPEVTGERLALTGSALDRGEACTKTLADGIDQTCNGVPSTPVLDWEPLPYASEYRIRIARDPDFTNSELDPTPPRTVNTRWAPSFTYPDRALEESQANNAYYWFIQPCKSDTQCGPDPKSTINPSKHAFKKTSPAVQLVSPAHDAVVGDTELSFTWEDYYDTNQAVSYAATGETSYQSAKQYRIQVSTQPTFATLEDTAVVDQPTYTATDKLYPQGPLHWRVQAIDANDNALAWSTPRIVHNNSPKPVLVSPVPATLGDVPVVSGAVPFRWEAEPFAGTYTIQVAANNDANFASTNLKVNKSTKRSAFSTGITGANVLPPSETPYLWRVQRVDPSGNEGPWSEPAKFKVALDLPDLQAPAVDAVVGPSGLVLRWAPVSEAATYKVEYRKLNTTSITAATTPVPAYAPTAALTVGTTYEWRVTTINSTNQSAASGGWRQFTIGGAPTATAPASIEGSAVLDTTLTAVDPQWSVPDVTNTYVWRRNGTPIEGATASSYDVTVADVGQQISVVVTGTSPEFGTGTSTSAPVTGKPGAGPTALGTPQISGSGQVGSLLTATLPEWDPSDTEVSLQWTRNGTDISGADQPTYEVASNDLNTSIALEVIGILPGRTPTTVASNSISATQGPAAKALSAPTISGTPKVGTQLGSTAPSWDVSGVSNSVQWLRNGSPISMATQPSYFVQPADVGASISVRYTGSSAGRADGVAESSPVVGLAGDVAPVPPPSAPLPGTPSTQPPPPGAAPTPVGPVASTTALKAPKGTKAGRRARVTVTVRATGVASPAGVVKLFVGKKLVAKIKLKAGAKGIGNARLPKLKKGRYKLRAVYSGSSAVAASKSKRVVLKVTG